MKNSPRPRYCITLDTDWASDQAIRFSLDLIIQQGIIPTVFATNPSKILTEYSEKGVIELGLHPNFLPNSTHGEDYQDVINSLFEMYPTAKTFRSHAYFDNSIISRELFRRGIKYDANLCLHLQEGLKPMHHESGLTRFPTFLEDGVFLFYYKQTSLNEQTKTVILSDGLKIFNFHPTSVFLNIDTKQNYNRYKNLAKTLSNKHISLACSGFGARTLLNQIIELIKNNGYEFHSLNKLYNTYKNIV
ncbi:hypothetical protein [Maridesulfovibrio hydrothermalis]|uniref:YdjC family protein n=1 Tax=Maridesulfovibrio hydrothermalis AM13 = DSM 14728 TaxID=1121451 RepID=L0RCB7_9BACT|nr:hypothetical protein [Maridesulfovibrio hydrothermalis]CCO23211.1 conserved protein of unknown function [Maridesulfovibrio hydrothermalis AM13 = DSM 14728]